MGGADAGGVAAARPPAGSRLNSARTVPQLLAALWRSPWVRLLVYLLLALLAYSFARLLLSVIVTGLVAYAIAFLFQPILLWLERRRVRRVFGVLLVVIVLLAVIALLFWTVLSQVVNLLAQLPQLLQRLPDLIGSALDRLSGVPGFENVQVQLQDFLTQQVRQLNQDIGPTLQQLLSSGGALLGGAVGVVGGLAQGVFVLILSLYFMLDYKRVGASLLQILPRAWQPAAVSLSEDVSVSFGGYIRGQLLIGLAVGALVAVGLLILGIPNALAIGLLAAVLDIVPYLGPVISAVPAVLLALPDGWIKVALVVLVFLVANQLEGNFLSPYVLGRTTDLSSAAVLLGILAGLTLAGLVGALLAVPTVALLKRWLEHYWLPSRAHDAPPGGE